MDNNGKQDIGLSPSAIKLAYRLMGLKEHVKYDIMFLKLGDTWVYEIQEQRTKVECAR